MTITAARTTKVRETGRNKGATFYSELLNKIKEEGLLKRSVSFYLWYFALITVASIAVWAAVYFIGQAFAVDVWWQLLVLPLAVLHGALTAQYAFIAHELAHNQVFNSRKLNDWGGLIVANLFAGLSYGFWLAKHNRHHAKPNMIDGDPDISLRVIAFTTEQKFEKPSTERLLTNHQGWLFPFLSLFTAGDLLLDSLKSVMRTTGRGSQRRFFELALLVFRFFFPLVMFCLMLNIWVGLATWAVYMLSFGGFMGNAFAVNHIGMPLVEKDSKIGFLERQVLTSRNIKPGWFTDFMMGGLNYQVEHHLFPSMARPSLKKARELTIEFCKEKGITYTEVSFAEGYASVIRFLNAVGTSTKVDPFICPMVTAYRQTS